MPSTYPLVLTNEVMKTSVNYFLKLCPISGAFDHSKFVTCSNKTELIAHFKDSVCCNSPMVEVTPTKFSLVLH